MARRLVVSSHDKPCLRELAEGFAELGNWELFATGGTYSEIEASGVDIPLHTFAPLLDNDRLRKYRGEREDEAYGVSRLLSWSKLHVRQAGLMVVDAAFVNPVPPEVKRVNHQVLDEGGYTMLNAAVQGKRLVARTPEDIPTLIEAAAALDDAESSDLLTANVMIGAGVVLRDQGQDLINIGNTAFLRHRGQI